MPKKLLTLFQMERAKFPIQEITDPATDRNPAQNSPSAARANAYSRCPSPNRAPMARSGRPKNRRTTMPRAILVAFTRMFHAEAAARATALKMAARACHQPVRKLRMPSKAAAVTRRSRSHQAAMLCTQVGMCSVSQLIVCPSPTSTPAMIFVRTTKIFAEACIPEGPMALMNPANPSTMFISPLLISGRNGCICLSDCVITGRIVLAACSPNWTNIRRYGTEARNTSRSCGPSDFTKSARPSNTPVNSGRSGASAALMAAPTWANTLVSLFPMVRNAPRAPMPRPPATGKAAGARVAPSSAPAPATYGPAPPSPAMPVPSPDGPPAPSSPARPPPRRPKMPLRRFTSTLTVAFLPSRSSSIASSLRMPSSADRSPSGVIFGFATFFDSRSRFTAAFAIFKANSLSFKSTAGVAIRFDSSPSWWSSLSADRPILEKVPDAWSVARTRYSRVATVTGPRSAPAARVPLAVPARRPGTAHRQSTRSAPRSPSRLGDGQLAGQAVRRGGRGTASSRWRKIPLPGLDIVLRQPRQAGHHVEHPRQRGPGLLPQRGGVLIGEQPLPVVIDGAFGDELRPGVPHVRHHLAAALDHHRRLEVVPFPAGQPADQNRPAPLRHLYLFGHQIGDGKDRILAQPHHQPPCVTRGGRPHWARLPCRQKKGGTVSLASEHVVLSAPMSFTGSTRRIWRRWRPAAAVSRGWRKAAWWTLLWTLLILAWLAVLAWYFLFGLLLVPYRIVRRVQRTGRRNQLRHAELAGQPPSRSAGG